MRGVAAILAIAMAGLAAAGCAPTSEPTFATPVQPGQILTANLGDTVLDARHVEPELFLGTVETGRTVVRFTAVDGRRAVFVRQHMIRSDSFEAELWTPVGVPPPPLAGYTSTTQPLTLALRVGEVMPLAGRRLTVRGVSRNSLQYSLD